MQSTFIQSPRPFESILTRTPEGALRMPELDANLPTTIILTIISYDHILQFACRQTCKEMMTAVISPDVNADVIAAASSGNIALYDMISCAYDSSKPVYIPFRTNLAIVWTTKPADLFIGSELSTEALVELIDRDIMSVEAPTFVAMTDRDDAGILTEHLMTVNRHRTIPEIKCLILRAIELQNIPVINAIIKYCGHPIRVNYNHPENEHELWINPCTVEDSLCPKNVKMLRWHLDHGASINESRVLRTKSAEVVEVLRQYGYRI